MSWPPPSRRLASAPPPPTSQAAALDAASPKPAASLSVALTHLSSGGRWRWKRSLLHEPIGAAAGSEEVHGQEAPKKATQQHGSNREVINVLCQIIDASPSEIEISSDGMPWLPLRRKSLIPTL